MHNIVVAGSQQVQVDYTRNSRSSTKANQTTQARQFRFEYSTNN